MGGESVGLGDSAGGGCERVGGPQRGVVGPVYAQRQAEFAGEVRVGVGAEQAGGVVAVAQDAALVGHLACREGIGHTDERLRG